MEVLIAKTSLTENKLQKVEGRSQLTSNTRTSNSKME